MSFKELAELIARYVWPLLIVWNGYIFTVTQEQKEEMFQFRLHVAENYTGKKDLKEMFDQFEDRFDQRFEDFLKTLKP